jgi:competence protein ComEA
MARALPAADLKNLNLARKLEDGEAVVVSSLADAAGNVVEGGDSPAQVQAGTGNKSVRVGTGKVNINTASPQELDEKLPGIGPALAQRIVDYRTSQGRFGSIEDIKEVSGIGDKKYEAIKDLITVQ